MGEQTLKQQHEKMFAEALSSIPQMWAQLGESSSDANVRGVFKITDNKRVIVHYCQIGHYGGGGRKYGWHIAVADKDGGVIDSMTLEHGGCYHENNLKKDGGDKKVVKTVVDYIAMWK